MEPRLKVGDLVRVKRAMAFKGKKLKAADNGILLEININNGLAIAKVFWQQQQAYTDDIPTEYLVRVEI